MLVEKPRLSKADFIVTENYHIRLRENTAKRLIEKIKSNFNSKVPYKGKNYYYQNILFDNVKNIADYILTKSKKLEFNIPMIEIQRDDTSEIREMILKMTPKQRRELGINKSTLWYMKKKIANRKIIKIYDKLLSKLDPKKKVNTEISI